MKATVTESTITVTLEMTQTQLNNYMQAMGGVSSVSLKNLLNFTTDQVNSVQGVWFSINNACDKKWNA